MQVPGCVVLLCAVPGQGKSSPPKLMLFLLASIWMYFKRVVLFFRIRLNLIFIYFHTAPYEHPCLVFNVEDNTIQLLYSFVRSKCKQTLFYDFLCFDCSIFFRKMKKSRGSYSQARYRQYIHICFAVKIIWWWEQCCGSRSGSTWIRIILGSLIRIRITVKI